MPACRQQETWLGHYRLLRYIKAGSVVPNMQVLFVLEVSAGCVERVTVQNLP